MLARTVTLFCLLDLNDRCRRFIAAGCVVIVSSPFGHSAKQIDKPCQDLDLLRYSSCAGALSFTDLWRSGQGW